MATTGHRTIQVRIVLSGKPAPWRILQPYPTEFYEARKRNRKVNLTIQLDHEPHSKQTIELSNVRIRKHEKKGGTIGAGYTIEEWFFSGQIWINQLGLFMGRGSCRLYFEEGRLTGEINAWIPLPPKAML